VETLGIGSPGAVEKLASDWERTRVLAVGEIHGTNEVPRLIATLVAREAPRFDVVVGLERGDNEMQAIDAYLASQGTEADRAMLIKGPGWSGSYSDGRSSSAVFDLVEQIRVLRHHGAKVSLVMAEVVPTDRSVLQGPGNAQRYVNSTIAETVLRLAASGSKRSLVILLVGAYHLRLASADEVSGPSISQRIAGIGPLIAIVDGKGSSWNCTDKGCGAHVVEAGSQLMALGSPEQRAGMTPARFAILMFPSLTASRPAFDDAPSNGH
jgi:hypothetical protein